MSLTDDLKKLVGIKPRWPHVELELATGYGLAHDVLKKIRTARLARGRHWDLVKGLVCYNDAGKAALEIALGIKVPEADSAPNIPAAPAKNFVPPKPGEIRKLVVVAIVRNRRILKARDQDRVAWVRVRNSGKFRVGMELEASFVAGEQWDLVGRCPRFAGKY